MLTFTERARQEVEAYLARKEDGIPRAVRIGPPGEDGAPYELALVDARRPAADDVEVEVDGAPFPVHVAEACRSGLRGATVRFVEAGAEGDDEGFDVVPDGEGEEDDSPADATAEGGDVEVRVREVITEHVNPTVAAHGGALELVEVRDGVARVEMSGGCQGCAASALTLQAMVRRMISSRVPEVRDIEDVTDHSAGDDPYYPTADELRQAAAGGS